MATAKSTTTKSTAKTNAEKDPTDNTAPDATDEQLKKAGEDAAKAEQAKVEAQKDPGVVDLSSQPPIIGETDQAVRDIVDEHREEEQLPKVVMTEHFVASKEQHPSGSLVVTIAPRGWVGPPPLQVGFDHLKELSDALGKL